MRCLIYDYMPTSVIFQKIAVLSTQERDLVLHSKLIHKKHARANKKNFGEKIPQYLLGFADSLNLSIEGIDDF